MTNNVEKNDCNIYLSYLEEDDVSNINNTELDLSILLSKLENHTFINNDLTVPHIINYNENYTVKELLLICNYYGVSKELKSFKCNKDEIIQFLVDFESNPNNSDIVFKRKNMWFYINEIKNDKFMKKYVLW